MKRGLLVGFAMVLSVALAVPSAGASSRRPSAREQVAATWARLRARAVERSLHPRPAQVSTGARGVTVPVAWQRVRAVEQISQDSSNPQPGSEPDTQAEPYIAMDPNDDQHVVAVMQQGRFPDGGSVGPGYATSLDGGRTWVTAEFPGVTVDGGGPWDRASDPWVAFGPNGIVYAVLLVFDNTCPSGLDVIRSDDGGITWNTPVHAQNDTSCAVFNDKESIAVDTTLSSPHFGRVYIAWDRLSSGQPIVFKYSDDQGQTWSSLINVQANGSVGVGANVLPQPNGNVTVVYINGVTGFEVSQTSTDGGTTWGAAATIGLDEEGSPPDMRVNCGLPTFAVDPVTSSMYVAWCDTRFRSDGLNDILVWKSTNGATSWTGPVKANPDASGSGITHLDAGIAANNHAIHVFYQTRQYNGSYSKFVGTSYIHSEDDGVMYTGEVAIGPRADLKYAAQAGGLFLGDYLGMTASATSAHAVWCRSSKPSFDETYHQTTWSAVILR